MSGVNIGVILNFSPTIIFLVAGSTSKLVARTGASLTVIVLVLIHGTLSGVSVYTAEIVIFPSLTPVTVPTLLTVAIAVSDELHVTYWLVASFGVNIFSSCNVLPISTVASAGVMAKSVAGTAVAVTCTVHVITFPGPKSSATHERIAVPTATPFIVQLLSLSFSTVNIDVLEEENSTFLLIPSAGV